MSLSVCIVIRSAGERTLARCAQIAKDQLKNVPVITIKESPFSAAVKKTFEIGIEHNKNWTLALDADILLRKNAVSDLIRVAESLPDNFFMVQGRVLDKLFCFSRNGGPHLFRTAFLKEALGLVPSHTESIRPEGETVRRMIKKGYHRYKGTEVYGLHDFEQSYEDIYRTAFVHAIKFKSLIPYFKNEWENRKELDIDYDIALRGLVAGGRYEFSSMPERREIERLAKEASDTLELEPKKSILDSIDPDEVLQSFYISEAGAQLENKHHNSVLRSDKEVVKPKKGLTKKIFNYLKNILIRQ